MASRLGACFFAVDELERIVFTIALVGEWRPAGRPLSVAIFAQLALGLEPELDLASALVARLFVERVGAHRGRLMSARARPGGPGAANAAPGAPGAVLCRLL